MSQTKIFSTAPLSHPHVGRTVQSSLVPRTIDMEPMEAPPPRTVVAQLPKPLIGARYRLDAKIGEGSFATVWQARDTHLDRDVALKVFSAGTITAQAVNQVLREARASGKIVSDHVIRINNSCIDTAHNVIAIDMELCREFGTGGESQNGQELARRVGCAPRDAARWVMQAARGVDEAHRQCVFHRDLKTANILVRPFSGRAQVVDFGLAGFHIAPVRSAGSTYMTVTIDTHGHRGGLRIAGTPEYMAPEQAAGLPLLDPERRADDRTLLTGIDVYGLGAVLFELLTGKPPHAAESTADALDAARANHAWRAVLARSGAPRALRDIVSKALSTQRVDRYASAGLLADDLDAYLAHRPTVAEARRPLTRMLLAARRRPALASLFAMLVAALALSIYAPVVVSTANSKAAAAKRQEIAAKGGRDAAVRERDEAKEGRSKSDQVANRAMGERQRAVDELDAAKRQLDQADTQAKTDAANLRIANAQLVLSTEDAANLRARIGVLEGDVQQRDATIRSERQAHANELEAERVRHDRELGEANDNVAHQRETLAEQRTTIDGLHAELDRQSHVIEQQEQTIAELRRANPPTPTPTVAPDPRPDPVEREE